ncbi:MAG: hypothetical protein ACT6S0_00450 [Roseateles sp.]|uniref:HXXEE domain-containing protein n=1 Tax=Roseateles asaccharophilus TaxID=582607 RepID=A0ABU2AG59_9BURK|nr:hypothetical protein [Roseateles asaccharophilus]MDR7336202.1 hypothetical protein [Roseateles asaccharophilus]
MRNHLFARTVGIATAYTVAVLATGFAAFGLVTMLVFTAGFVGGLTLWLALPTRGTWLDVRWPFWLVMLLFIVHRIEEKQFGFFAMLSSVTGVATPELLSPAVVALVLLSVGGWLLVPWLMSRRKPLGSYFAWSFFASMGITELAHWLVFPFMQGAGAHAVPGMWSVLLLAPTAWWGMSRLYRPPRT